LEHYGEKQKQAATRAHGAPPTTQGPIQTAESRAQAANRESLVERSQIAPIMFGAFALYL